MAESIEVEFLAGEQVKLTVEEGKTLIALLGCDPFLLFFEKFLAPIERDTIDALRAGSFYNETTAEKTATQATLQMAYEISQIRKRIVDQILVAESKK